MPTVSIAMPAYNCERFIAQSIESLLAQTYGDFELVISDNASTDGTESVCRHYEALDPRVRYVRRTDNIGGPGNFRHVFSLCQGRLHKWSTADDYWDPRFLAEAVAVLEREPDVVLCYPRTRLVDAAGLAIEDYDDNLDLREASPRLRYLRLYRSIGLCNAHLGLIRREAMLQTRLIQSHKASDVDFLGHLSLLGKFALLPEVRFFRRFHPTSSSWQRGDAAHQKAYYSPGKKWGRWERWNRWRFRLGTVAASPLPLGERAAVMLDLLKGMRHDRVGLVNELWGGGMRRSS